MGSGCNCSRKSTERIKENHPTTAATLISKALFPSEGRSTTEQLLLLQTFQDQHQVEMHKKIREVCTHLQAELPNGVGLMRLNTVKMKDRDWQHFTYCLGFCPMLTRLHLWKVSISPASLDLLASYIMGMPNLQSLTLGDMHLNSCQLTNLSEALKDLEQLQELSLTVNYLDSTHLAMLVPGIEGLHQLETLQLDENEIGDAGAVIMVELVVKLPSLRSVSLKFNSIGNKGFITLFDMQKQHRSFKLLLDGNDLTDEEFEQLEKVQV